MWRDTWTGADVVAVFNRYLGYLVLTVAVSLVAWLPLAIYRPLRTRRNFLFVCSGVALLVKLMLLCSSEPGPQVAVATPPAGTVAAAEVVRAARAGGGASSVVEIDGKKFFVTEVPPAPAAKATKLTPTQAAAAGTPGAAARKVATSGPKRPAVTPGTSGPGGNALVTSVTTGALGTSGAAAATTPTAGTHAGSSPVATGTQTPAGPAFIDRAAGYSVRFPAGWTYRTLPGGDPWVLTATDGTDGLINVGFAKLPARMTTDDLRPEQMARAIRSRPETTVATTGYATIDGRRCLWHKYTGPLATAGGSPRMTSIHYVLPLGDGRALELRLSAPPAQFDKLALKMRQAVETFHLLTPAAAARAR